jgi:hypothetical protein
MVWFSAILASQAIFQEFKGIPEEVLQINEPGYPVGA